jgi:hypothetical protein
MEVSQGAEALKTRRQEDSRVHIKVQIKQIKGETNQRGHPLADLPQVGVTNRANSVDDDKD